MADEPGAAVSVAEMVDQSVEDALRFARTVDSYGEQSAVVEAYVDLGLPFDPVAVNNSLALEDLQTYRNHVGDRLCAAWMDNTTLVTASALLSERGPDLITPLTIWDLVTFFRAVVCYEHIYHHKHPEVDDGRINGLLGSAVLKAVPLPMLTDAAAWSQDQGGAHEFTSRVWFDAYIRLKELRKRAGTRTVDGQELAALREGWARALQREDLSVYELVNVDDATRRWASPSNKLLYEMADVTDVRANWRDLDQDNDRARLLHKKWGDLEASRVRLGELLTDLNLRAYVNQQLADFFSVPYEAAAARVPFRRHLLDRAVQVQSRLYSVAILEDRYAELAQDVQLRLPLFLALALLGAHTLEDLWSNLAEQRTKATPFRSRRVELDEALGRRDLKEMGRVSKALRTDCERLAAALSGSLVAAGGAIVQEVSKGNLEAVSMGIAGAQAVAERLVSSSLRDRLKWRLTRPHLLYLNNLIDEAHHLTEAMPDFARLWRISEREQDRFASRFMAMAELQQA